MASRIRASVSRRRSWPPTDAGVRSAPLPRSPPRRPPSSWRSASDEGCAALPGLPVAVLLGLAHSECSQGQLGQRQEVVRLLRLGLAVQDLLPGPLDLVTDVQPAGVEVDGLPREAQHLPSPQIQAEHQHPCGEEESWSPPGRQGDNSSRHPASLPLLRARVRLGRVVAPVSAPLGTARIPCARKGEACGMRWSRTAEVTTMPPAGALRLRDGLNSPASARSSW